MEPHPPVGHPNVAEMCQILEDYAIEDVHEILIRNGMYLPARGGHWLTKKLMLQMWRGEVYCPYYGDMKLRPCPKPPSRQALVDEVNKEIVRRYRD